MGEITEAAKTMRDGAKAITRSISRNRARKRLTTYIARVCWNTKNWVQPSGDACDSEVGGTYNSKHGFGHEEWLFNFQWIIDGWKYAFLQPVNKSIGKLKGSTINLRLFTIRADGNRVYVGEIDSCQVLTDAEAAKTVSKHRANGWLRQMRQQVRAVSGNARALQSSPLELFNIRFKPEDASLYDPPVPVAKRDYIRNLNRYSLVPLVGRRAVIEKQWRGRVAATKEKSTGKQHRTGSDDTLADLVHNQMQNELVVILRAKYGNRSVVVESDFVDISLKFEKRLAFIEVKSDSRPVHAVRAGIGQLLQYDYIAKGNGGAPTELVIAAPGAITPKGKAFVDHLRKRWNMPIRYVCFRSGMKEKDVNI